MGKRFLCRICLPLLLWFAFSGYRQGSAEESVPPGIPEGETITVCGSIYRQEVKDSKQSMILKDISILSGTAEILPETEELQKQQMKTDSGIFSKNARILVYVKTPYELHIGESVIVSGEIRYPKKARNPGGFDAASYYHAQKIEGFLQKAVVLKSNGQKAFVMDTLSRLRRFLSDRIYKAAPEKDAGILSAMLLGDRSGLDAEVKSLYQDNGIIHILAISGLHISMIGMLLYQTLRKTGMRHAMAGIAAAVFMIAYAAMTGFAYSAVRAVIMFLLFLLSQATGRTYDLPTALMLAAAGILLFQSAAVTQAGFLLSFAAVAGVLLGNTWNARKLKGTALGISISVQLTTIPLIAWYYYQIPLYGIFLNLLVVPMVPFIVGFAAAGMAGGAAAMYPAHLLLTVLEWICDRIRLLPGAVTVVKKPELWQILFYFAVLGAGVFLLEKGFIYRKIRNFRNDLQKSPKIDLIKLTIAIILITGVFFFPQKRPFTMTFLDVGQGDGCCIENENGAVFFVDGGSSSEKALAQYTVEPFLMSSGIAKVDYWMVSHYDTDHISSLKEILEGYVPGLLGNNAAGISIGTILLPVRSRPPEAAQEICDLAKKNGISVRFVQKDDILREDDLTIRFLAPQADAVYENENAASMVAEIAYQGFRALLTGDVEGEAEEELVENGSIRTLTVLKAAHHGSGNSTSEIFLKAARPELTIISCGEKNRYGHPHQELLQRAAESGSAVLRTDESGAIKITVRNGRYRVKGYRSY